MPETENLIVRVEKNDRPLVCVPIPSDWSLGQLRSKLGESGHMKTDDYFLDSGKYRIQKEHEDTQKVSDFIEKKSGMIKIAGAKGLGEKIKAQIKAATAPDHVVKELMAKMKADQVTHNMKPEEVKELTDKIERNLAEILPKAVESTGLADDPLALDADQWRYLIRKNHLLGGINIEQEIPLRSFRKACDLKRDIPRFMYWDISEVTASSTYTQRTHNYIRSKFRKEEASASFAFASVSVEHSRTERAASQEEKKSLYMTGEWNFPRAILKMEPADVTPSKGFVAAVDKALKVKTENESYQALVKVFNEYGHVWPTEVVLGGQLQLTHTKDVAAHAYEKSEEETLRVAVAAKFGSFSGSAGYTQSTATEEQNKEIKELQQKRFTATGGNTLLAQNPTAWVSSVAPYNSWSVIKMSKLVPLYKLLGDQQRQKIDDLLEKYERKEERVLNLNPLDRISLTYYYDLEEFNKGDNGEYKKEERALMQKIPPYIGLVINKTGGFLSCKTKSDEACTFQVEFPIDGRRDLIALRSSQKNLPPYVCLRDIDSMFPPQMRKMIKLPPLPQFPLFLLQWSIDPYCIFQIEIFDEDKALVALKPYQTDNVTGNKAIPRYISIFGPTKFFPWNLSAEKNGIDPFCVFQIRVLE